jgi:flagella basal body P-ring formation protein FlgA
MKFVIAIICAVFALLAPIEVDGAALKDSDSRYLTTTEVIESLKQTVSVELPTEVTVELSGLYTTAEVPRGFTPKLYSSGPPVGTIRFEFERSEHSASGISSHVSGNVTVRAFGKIAVTTVPIRHADTIDQSKYTFQRRDLTPLVQKGYFLEGTHPEQLRANGYIRPGTILCASNTQAPMAVERMQTVELIHRHGTLTISATVTALESGRINDWIRVKNPRTNRIVEARVAESGVVTTR